MTHRSRILVISDRKIATEADIPESSGWRLAAALAKIQDVILAVPERTGLSHRDFAIVYYNRRNIALIAADSDAVVLDARTLTRLPQLIATGTPVAAGLEAVSARARPGDLPGAGLEGALASADFFFCPDENSRGLWLKSLDRAGRINPFTHRKDGALRRLIDVAAAAGGKPGSRGPASPHAPLAALESFCASPRYAADRGTGFNRAKLPVREKHGILLPGLRRLRRRLRRGGPRPASPLD
jgi:hypothetical protein